jgi:hypothetical protein
MKSTPLTTLRLLFTVAITACFAACTSAEVRQDNRPGIRGVKISTVSVTPGTALDADDLELIREKDVERILTTAIRNRLSDAGKLQPDGAALVVNISSIRVRSTASAVMLGVMAGPDHLEANVAVVDKGQTLKTFVGEGSRTSGAFAGPGSGGRAEGLAEELAIAIVDQL